MSKGTLIYLPSESVLVNGENPTSLKKLNRPGVFLVVSDTETCYSIIHEGSQWLVNKRGSLQVREDFES